MTEGYTINRTLLRQLVMDSGGIRPFCKKAGINRQALYNLFESAMPDYTTICRISATLSLTGEQIIEVFFCKA